MAPTVTDALAATPARKTARTTTARKTAAAKNTAKTAAAKAKSPDAIDRHAVLKAMRRELVAGTTQAPLEYALSLAEFAVNARRTFGVFKILSTNNRLLLEAQRRKLNEEWKWLLAGSAQWAKLGREPRVDAQPKTIWIPNMSKVEDPATGDNDEVFRGFLPFKGYFDYTDTISLNEDYVEPNWDVSLATGGYATLDALVQVAEAEGLTVQFTDWGARNENGALTADGTLTVDDSLPTGNQIKVLAHQLAAHHLGHLGKLAAAPRRDRDEVLQRCFAEAVLAELLVMKMLGLDETVGNDVTASAAAYLSQWVTADGEDVGTGHRKRIALLDEKIEVSLTAAGKVIGRYLQVSGQEPAQPAED